MLNWLQSKLLNTWDNILHWSGWHDAGSIVIARSEVVVGFLTAVLAGLDWAALTALDFANGVNRNVLIPAALLIVKGVISEWTRRHGDPNL